MTRPFNRRHDGLFFGSDLEFREGLVLGKPVHYPLRLPAASAPGDRRIFRVTILGRNRTVFLRRGFGFPRGRAALVVARRGAADKVTERQTFVRRHFLHFLDQFAASVIAAPADFRFHLRLQASQFSQRQSGQVHDLSRYRVS
ncbi:hypothetical protein ebA4375 [Aromatoleum aromaticum EbN1]|uniref:Uncharacterized protein n=1 Tax=Aromatoleum aromaticum (strain DSM 19018 / LMG 30748 / EbN1) TaxID=76114 RepID=Q5P258_AROAE|nr:hypothetical protein ebA4375 [Aromatoleum aromaticum EbN1]